MTAIATWDGERLVQLQLAGRDFLIWSFKMLTLACPLQIEGEVDGVPFFFRERHDRWRLEVFGHVIAHGPSAAIHLDPFSAMAYIQTAVDEWTQKARKAGLVVDVI